MILCKKCETGNPEYLRYCSNCEADLFAESNVHTEPAPLVDEAKLRRNQKIAVGLSLVTSAIKIWILYNLEKSAHMNFPQVRDLLAIGMAPLGAALASFKSRRWHWALVLDSIAVLGLLAFGVFIFVASRFTR